MPNAPSLHSCRQPRSPTPHMTLTLFRARVLRAGVPHPRRPRTCPAQRPPLPLLRRPPPPLPPLRQEQGVQAGAAATKFKSGTAQARAQQEAVRRDAAGIGHVRPGNEAMCVFSLHKCLALPFEAAAPGMRALPIYPPRTSAAAATVTAAAASATSTTASPMSLAASTVASTAPTAAPGQAAVKTHQRQQGEQWGQGRGLGRQASTCTGIMHQGGGSSGQWHLPLAPAARPTVGALPAPAALPAHHVAPPSPPRLNPRLTPLSPPLPLRPHSAPPRPHGPWPGPRQQRCPRPPRPHLLWPGPHPWPPPPWCLQAHERAGDVAHGVGCEDRLRLHACSLLVRCMLCVYVGVCTGMRGEGKCVRKTKGGGGQHMAMLSCHGTSARGNNKAGGLQA